jgi:hypothetical protein
VKNKKIVKFLSLIKNLIKVDNITQEEELFDESHDHHSIAITKSDNENTLDQYYKCIICGPMFFQSKKKNYCRRLWKARVTSSTTTTSTRNQQPYPSVQDQYYQLSNETSVTNCYIYSQQQEKQNLHQSSSDSIGSNNNNQEPTSTFQSVLRNCCANSNSGSAMDLLSDSLYQLFRLLMSQLKKGSQCETLYQAVEGLSTADVPSSKSSLPHHQATNCVLVPRQKLRGEEPQVIACRLWRWSDLYDPNEIRRIPKCPNEKDPIYVCCNPAHWSRLCQPGNIYNLYS